jgi:hypothetical protein
MQSAVFYQRCKRLCNMSWDELWVRTQQELAKRLDLILFRSGHTLIHCSYTSRSNSCGRFFFTGEDVPCILAALQEHVPESVDIILRQAKDICNHRFDLLGYKALDYGPNIDWHLDAVHGKRAPYRPWFKVHYLDFEEVGDAKVTWELNRHQHLVTLAKAYRISEDPRYALEIFREWYDWQEQNPYPIGINWASSLEVAFRSFSWLWVWYLLEGCRIVPVQFSTDLERALMLNARHIERYLSTYFSPNTHLIGEATGLFFIGTLFPSLPAAKRWQERGWQILLSEAQAQVQPDGMYFEQSSYYHTYALDFLLHCRILAAVNNVSIPDAFDETIQRMLDVLCGLRNTGPLPRMGDDDGGRLFDGRRNRTEHLLDPLATGATLYQRADYKEAAIHLREETLWLLGAAGVTQFEDLEFLSPTSRSIAFQSSGIYVMSGGKQGAQQLVIDAGPQGAGRSGHAHADALSLQLAVNDQPLLIDPGTFLYADSGSERDRFRGTECHNTVQVDRTSQAEAAGPFGWQRLPKVIAERWETGATFDFFVGSHDGYTRLKHPIQHRRYIFYLKPSFWFVRDVLDGVGAHRLDLSWHFAPGSLSSIPGGATFTDDKDATLTVLFTMDQEHTQELLHGWHSPAYGMREPAPVLRFTTHAQLPAELITVLLPTSASDFTDGCVQRIVNTKSTVRAYRYSWDDQVHYLFFADQDRHWQFGPWSSDALLLAVSTGMDREFDQIVICDGSYLVIDGQQVVNSQSFFSSRELALKKAKTLRLAEAADECAQAY